MNIFNGHAGPVTAGGFTRDGKKIVSTSEDSSFIIWDPKTAAAEFRLTGEDARFHVDPINSVCVNKDSSLAITGDVAGKARLVNIMNGTVSSTSKCDMCLYICVFIVSTCRLSLLWRTTQTLLRHPRSVMCFL